MIGIIDCHIGNLGSLQNAFAYLEAPTQVVADPAGLEHCEAVVLPGVGAFDPAMSAVQASGFAAAIGRHVAAGRPLLGICLGMQMLAQGSEEGSMPGLGLVDGRVLHLRHLGCNGKVPHVGFNAVQAVAGESAFLSGTEGLDFYFVHSFGLQSAQPECATAAVEYEGARFVAALQHRNVFGTQFHPEKSGEAGLMMLRRFLSCSRNA